MVLSTLPGNSPQGTPSSLVCGAPFCPVFVGRPARFVPCISGLNLGVFRLGPFSACHGCCRSVPAHVGRALSVRDLPFDWCFSQVLPEFVKSLDLPNVRGIQFMPNGVVRVT